MHDIFIFDRNGNALTGIRDLNIKIDPETNRLCANFNMNGHVSCYIWDIKRSNVISIYLDYDASRARSNADIDNILQSINRVTQNALKDIRSSIAVMRNSD